MSGSLSQAPSLDAEELARLLDTQRIVDLHYRYAALMDADDYAALPTLLTEDAVLEGYGDADGVGARAIAVNIGALGGSHIASQRTISNVRVALDGDRARAVAAFRSSHLDSGVEGAHAHEGWFLSELVRTAEGWRFARLKRIKSLAQVLNTTPEGRAVRDEVAGWLR